MNDPKDSIFYYPVKIISWLYCGVLSICLALVPLGIIFEIGEWIFG